MPQQPIYSHQDLIRIGFQAKIEIMGAFARTHGIPPETARRRAPHGLLSSPASAGGGAGRGGRNEDAGQDY